MSDFIKVLNNFSIAKNVTKLIMWYTHKKWHTIRSKFWIYGYYDTFNYLKQ